MIRVLNAYAGIGGNRHLWPDDWQITAVEWSPRVAVEYQSRYPQDHVIIRDAHEYVMAHGHTFDAVWTSPPCPTHSRINNTRRDKPDPDPRLWEEIQHLRDLGVPYVVENVHTYYAPPIPPDLVTERHYYWTSCPPALVTHHWTPAKIGRRHETADELADNYGLPRLEPGSVPDRRLAMRNAVLPFEGLEVASSAFAPDETAAESAHESRTSSAIGTRRRDGERVTPYCRHIMGAGGHCYRLTTHPSGLCSQHRGSFETRQPILKAVSR